MAVKLKGRSNAMKLISLDVKTIGEDAGKIRFIASPHTIFILIFLVDQCFGGIAIHESESSIHFRF